MLPYQAPRQAERLAVGGLFAMRLFLPEQYQQEFRLKLAAKNYLTFRLENEAKSSGELCSQPKAELEILLASHFAKVNMKPRRLLAKSLFAQLFGLQKVENQKQPGVATEVQKAGFFNRKNLKRKGRTFAGPPLDGATHLI